MIVVDPAAPKGIVWIASYPKSGNTWLRIFLYHMMRIVGGYPREENELHSLDKASTYEARLFSLFEQFLGKPLATATPEEVSRVRPRVQAAIVDRAGGVALVKTHNVMGQVQGIPIINLPVSAGTIYIVRDPRDVALSLAAYLGGNVDDAIKVMDTRAYRTRNSAEAAYEIWGSWSEHVAGWTMRPHEAALVLRYEDLIASPEEGFAAVARHLRQNVTQEQLAEAIEASSFKASREQEEKTGFREQSGRGERFFREGRPGEWRERLSQSQVEHINATHREQMRRFGYLTN